MAAPTAINQLRLMVGDTSTDFVWLADETYKWLIETHSSQLGAAIKALEMIINQVALSPQSVQTEDLKETGPMVEALERRLKALKEEKISVPGDVAIVGCNDDQVASFVTPGLSTVKLHNDLVGMMAAKTLMECLYTKREQGLKIIVPNQLILRESCPE